jgi:peptidoglycan/LPS O-acetylase OafA/YrhL
MGTIGLLAKETQASCYLCKRENALGTSRVSQPDIIPSMRIKGLDGLRAIAFLLVFFYHTNWIEFGWIGVQLFFVLSGFLITGILMEMKTRLASASYFIKFYGRRFLRIFPLYYFYLLVMWRLVSWMAINKIKPQYMNLFHDQLPYALAYVYNFYAASPLFDRFTNFLTHLWSLAVEEQFYIVWPLLIFLVPRTRYKAAFLSVIGFCVIFRFWIATLAPESLHVFLIADPLKAIYFLPFSHLDAFALGAILTVTDIPKPRAQFIAFLVGLPVLGIVTDALASGTWVNASNLGFPLLLPYADKAVWGYTLLNYFFAILIFGVARVGWFERILEFRPIAYLGKISYGLYVYHFAIIWFMTLPFGLSSTAPVPFINAAISLILTVIVAGFSYRLLEKPLMNLKDRFFAVPSGQVAQTPNPGQSH